MNLVQCARPGCATRTTPAVAARRWPDGVCELCRDPKLRAEVRETVARAKAAFAARKCWRPSGKRKGERGWGSGNGRWALGVGRSGGQERRLAVSPAPAW